MFYCYGVITEVTVAVTSRNDQEQQQQLRHPSGDNRIDDKNYCSSDSKTDLNSLEMRF